LTDDDFDRELPYWMRTKSALHFTPVAVAARAAAFLTPAPGLRVLDVGAGAGKFCIVAARAVPACTFVGVELRPQLVKLARRIAARAQLGNAIFEGGDALALDWSGYAGFYFYNPFAEQLHDTDLVLDRALATEPSRFVEYVTGARDRLAAAPVGTRVVTYHGLGESVPAGYDLVESHDALELWIQRGTRRATS
jgi:SAM-dependent methyltransferase